MQHDPGLGQLLEFDWRTDSQENIDTATASCPSLQTFTISPGSLKQICLTRASSYSLAYSVPLESSRFGKRLGSAADPALNQRWTFPFGLLEHRDLSALHLCEFDETIAVTLFAEVAFIPLLPGDGLVYHLQVSLLAG